MHICDGGGPTAKRKRIPKPVERQLADLDHHLCILREQLHALPKEEAKLKVVAASLRVLICRSSGTDGLIWRLCRRLKVDDRITIQAVGGVNKDHPQARGLQFSFVPINRAGFGPPDLPAQEVSFEKIVTDHEALFVGGENLTHDYLIKAVAQQMGLAHEDEGLEVPIAQLEQIFVNGVHPYVPILARDAEFAIEVGERVLEKAERVLGLQRPNRQQDYGNVSIVVRLTAREQSTEVVPLFGLRSYVADATVAATLAPQSLVFTFTKRGRQVGEMEASHPGEWRLGTDALFVLSYCSSAKRASTLAIPGGQRREIAIDVGWLHAEEMSLESVVERDTSSYYLQFICWYKKLLSSADARGLIELRPDEWGNWWSTDGQPLFVTEEDRKSRGVFPR